MMYNNNKVAKTQQRNGGEKQMINTAKLKGRIIEKGKTIQLLAPKIPCTPYTLGQKISNETPMRIEELEILANELEIPKNEIVEYFFYNQSCENATR